MPFQVFRRHQRKMLAVLAILAMFGFVLADSLPRFFNDGPAVRGADEVVATLYGRRVRESDLDRLRSERGRANAALGQLAPYFGRETFGPTTPEAIVDAYILERKADELGIPASPDLAKKWVYERAEQQHQALRLFNPGVPDFDVRDVSMALERVYRDGFGSEMSDLQFLAGLANQVRIQKVRELLAPALVTPLDAFEAYEAEQVRVEAKYVGFPAAEFLDGVPEPAAADLRAFYDRHASAVPDPTVGRVGFRLPRRIKVEFVTLGVNAIDLIREQIRSRPIAEEVRGEEGFTEQVAVAYAVEQGRVALPGETPLPPFLFNDDPTGALTPPPADFVDRYVAEQVEARVAEALRDQVDLIFDPVRAGMYEFVDELEAAETVVETGLEAELSALPELDRFLDESAAELRQQLGAAADRPEGLAFTRLGLTRLLADPEVVRSTIGPDGLTPEWRNYLQFVGIDWSSPAVRRQALELVQSSAGLEVPGLSEADSSFPVEIFERGIGLLEPREYTDPIGRRYLVWKTLDLPESTPPFDRVPEEVLAFQWRLGQARERARAAAEALAGRVRETQGDPPAVALSRFAEELNRPILSTGQRLATDPLDTFAPIQADEGVREAVFSLGDASTDRARVAADRSGDTFYTLALASRRDLSLPADGQAEQVVDYQNAVNNLTNYQRSSNADLERDAERVMTYLRREAGLPADWSPPEPRRSGG